MKVIRLKLADLKLPERNIRKHDEKQIHEFMRSIEMFGQIRPIVIDEDNTILCGNGQYETLKRMNSEYADCYCVYGLTPSQKKKLMISDNRIFELGSNDAEALDAFLLELSDDLDIPGYDFNDDLSSFLSSDVGYEADTGTGELQQTERRNKAAYDTTNESQAPPQNISNCREINPADFANSAFKHECPRCHFLFNEPGERQNV